MEPKHWELNNPTMDWMLAFLSFFFLGSLFSKMEVPIENKNWCYFP